MFNTIVDEWFHSAFTAPTEIQKKAWKEIALNKHILITAPTGSGKTLAAFLYGINSFIEGIWDCRKTSILYVSPLKALNSDIQVNLNRPLNELRALSEARKIAFPDITVGLRSGDTTQQERRRIFAEPPSIFITTPETLHILLSQEKGRTLLSHIRCVILDEIHSIAGNRRGSLMSANLERLVKIAGEFMRIGLSATVNPLDLAASFLGGNPCGISGEQKERRVEAIEAEGRKEFDLVLEEPPLTPGDYGDSYWENIANMSRNYLETCHSAIIFVNSRKMSETIARYLNRNREVPDVYAHHGSLSKSLRKNIETMLRKGDLKAIVATNSLELGIDIGYIEKVIFIQPPFTISSFVQKLGRAGHQVGAVSYGVCIPLNSLEKYQFAAYIESLRDHLLEKLSIPRCPLDVLSQFLISEALPGPVNAPEFLAIMRSSFTFRNLQEYDFYQTLIFLCGEYRGIPMRHIKRRLELMSDTDTFRALKGTSLAFYSSAGTIPDRGYYALKTEDNRNIGELDEQFVWERRLGDVFTFGNRRWRITAIDNSAVTVQSSGAKENAYVFWKADQLLTEELPYKKTGEAITAAVRKAADENHPPDRFIASLLHDDLFTASDTIYFEHTSVPGHTNGYSYIFIHTFFGGKINAALQYGIEGFLADRGIQGQVFCNNRQIVIISFEEFRFSLDRLFSGFTQYVYSSIENSGFFGVKFREIVNRFIILASPGFGKRRPLWLNRSKVKQFYLKIKGYRDNPAIKETWREIIEDTIDIQGAVDILQKIKEGRLREKEVHTGAPSPLCDEAVFRMIDMLMYDNELPLPSGNSSVSLDFYIRLITNGSSSFQISEEICEEFERRLQYRTDDFCPDSPKALLDYISERIIVPESEFDDICSRYRAVSEEMEIPEEVYRLTSGKISGITDSKGISVIRSIFSLDQNSVTVRRYNNNEEIIQGLLKRNDTADELLFLTCILAFYGPVTIERLSKLYAFDTEWLSTAIERIDSGNQDKLIKGQFISAGTKDQVMLFENFEHIVHFRLGKTGDTAIDKRRYLDHLIEQYTLQSDDTETIRKLLHYPFPPLEFLDIVLKLRLSETQMVLLEELVRERIIIPVMEDGKLILFDAAGAETEPGRKRKPCAVPEVGSFLFWELKDISGCSVSELVLNMKRDFKSGTVTCDSLEGIRSLLSIREDDISSRNKISYKEWKTRRVLPGRWYMVPKFIQPEEESVEEIEARKSAVRTLLERYGIIWRSLLKRESASFRFSSVRKVLRLMELSGEIISGYYIEGIEQRQYSLQSTINAIKHHESVIDSKIIYCREPAASSMIEASDDDLNLKRSFYMLYSSGKEPLFYYPGKKQLEGTAPDNYMKITELIEADVLREIHIESINGSPVFNSPYREKFLAIGAVPVRKSLRIDSFSIRQ